METRRIPVHIANLYPRTLQIRDLRAIDRNSMFTFWTFTMGNHLDDQQQELSSATSGSRLVQLAHLSSRHLGRFSSEALLAHIRPIYAEVKGEYRWKGCGRRCSREVITWAKPRSSD